MSDPREGLPPCLSLVRLDNRIATLVDYDVCQHEGPAPRFSVIATRVNDSWRRSHSTFHPEFPLWQVLADAMLIELDTDDPDEAKAAFAKGAEWVRTGEGP